MLRIDRKKDNRVIRAFTHKLADIPNGITGFRRRPYAESSARRYAGRKGQKRALPCSESSRSCGRRYELRYYLHRKERP